MGDPMTFTAGRLRHMLDANLMQMATHTARAYIPLAIVPDEALVVVGLGCAPTEARGVPVTEQSKQRVQRCWRHRNGIATYLHMSRHNVHPGLLTNFLDVVTNNRLQQVARVPIVDRRQWAAVCKHHCWRVVGNAVTLFELQQTLKPRAHPARLGQKRLGVNGILGHVQKSFIQHVVAPRGELGQQLRLSAAMAALQRHDDKWRVHGDVEQKFVTCRLLVTVMQARRYEQSALPHAGTSRCW